MLARWLQRAFRASSFVCKLPFHTCCLNFDLSYTFWLVGTILTYVLALLTWWWKRTTTRLSTVLRRGIARRRITWLQSLFQFFVLYQQVLLVLHVLLILSILWVVIWRRTMLLSIWALLIKIVCFCYEEPIFMLWTLIGLVLAALDRQLLGWGVQVWGWRELKLSKCVRCTLYF